MLLTRSSMVLWCFDVEVAGTVGVVTAGKVVFGAVDFYQGIKDAGFGVCGGDENAVWEGGDWGVEEVV